MSDEKQPETEEARTERLRRFVVDFCDGRIFTDRHCASIDEIRMCFMVLAFAEPNVIPEGTALVWEDISKAGPRGINGNPCFFSCNFMSQADWERVRPAIEREWERRKEIKV